MTKLYTATVVSFLLLCLAGETFGQQALVTDAKKQKLTNFSNLQNSLFLSGRQKALSLAKALGWPIIRKTKNGGLLSLQGVNSLGFPIYLITDNNTTAAATTQTNWVQPGGSPGLNLSGAGAFLNDKLAIWDGGAVYKYHQEFAGKTITIEDTASIIDHATHVSGTLLAKGVYPPAQGMAFNAATLHSYYFDNDVAKMSAAAPALLLSNHSYGDEAGWNFNDAANRWEWYGLPGDSVDYTFGFYGQRTQQWDQIAFDAPFYLIVESAGNAHAYPGPAVGSDYYGYQSIANQTIVDKGPRPAGISSNAGYESVSSTGNAKNILTVGAVNPLPFGPASSQDISVTSFSSWGPTNDGRIKPDIVADGVDVLSCGSSGPASYITLSGTSMSAPNVTGSLYLLQEYYAQKNGGNFMRAATLKGLACHTAVDAGNTGPDYIYGWGLLNMKNAALAITENGTKSLLKESILQQGQQQTYTVTASGDGSLAATISWTDPAGTPTPDGTVNSRTPKLVNDLDVRVSDGITTFYPWILNPSNPSAPAKTGDNVLDNIEQVYLPNAVPGKAYTITVSHKGTLQGGSQDYSLIVTGIGGSAYCTSGPLSNADSRVNNLTISNLNYTQPPGCTSYTDLTNLTVQLEQGKTYPLSITPGTCGANFNKAAKIYIDWNGDGIFSADELVATTGIFNATGTYTTNITVPVSVIPGNYSLMRVVLTETSDTSLIKPCGAYAKGETQDYRVQFLQAGTDAGITAIVSPALSGTCPSATQVTVSVKNFGSKAISNIPVTVTITAPGNAVTTLNQTYSATLQPLEQEKFTLNSTFNAIAGTGYNVTASTNLPNDPISANNEVSEIITVSSPASAAGLAAWYCVNSKQYQLSGAGDGEVLWYQNSNDTIPFASGPTVNVPQPPVNNTWYAGLNDFKSSIGPATKYVFAGGGYNQFTPYISVNTQIPVIIESARLYIGNPGKITFNVANLNGEIVSSATINAVATRANPQPGAQADDPSDKGAVYYLNLILPSAGAYTITAVYDSTATIYRSNAGVSGYPFKTGNIFSITGNNAVSATDTAYYKGFYYYFYDIKLKSAGCPSPARQPVTLTKLLITQNGGSLTSSPSTGYQWYLDDKPIPGATSQSYTPVQSGNYTVGTTLNTGCEIRSDNFVFVLISASQGNKGDIGLVVYPVPANSLLNIIFAAAGSGNLTLGVINAAGQVVYNSEQQITEGNVSTSIDISNLPPGVYVLKLLLAKKVYYSKIVIVR
ncbi:MAG: S8 family serine peptidase [Sphingobacteriales bacterium]